MTLKLLAIGFVAVFLFKLLFLRRFKDMKAWADRLANAFLVAIGIWMVVHLAAFAL
ncbi:MAG: hypothetical protein RIM84_12165 [Alphaproteobacteria bacterium]